MVFRFVWRYREAKKVIMEINIVNILALAQFSPILDEEVKARIKGLPPEALGGPGGKLHRAYLEGESTDLLSCLSDVGFSSDHIKKVKFSEEYDLFVKESTKDQQISTINKVLKKYEAEQTKKFLAETLNEISNDNSLDMSNFKYSISKKLDTISINHDKTSVESAADILFTDLTQSLESGKEIVLTTGYDELDDVIGGLYPGSMNILAGQQGKGKTGFACSLARKWCKRGLKVLFISLDMMPKEILERMILQESYEMGVPIVQNDFYKGTHQGIEKIKMVYDQIKDFRLEIYSDRDHLKVIDMIKQTCDVDVVILDHFHQLTGSTDFKMAGEIAITLKQTAKELNKWFIILCQYNRNSTTRENKAPQKSDLRGTGGLEDNPDIILALHEPDKDFPEDYELHLLKQRRGREAILSLQYLKDHQIFKFEKEQKYV